MNQSDRAYRAARLPSRVPRARLGGSADHIREVDYHKEISDQIPGRSGEFTTLCHQGIPFLYGCEFYGISARGSPLCVFKGFRTERYYLKR